MGRLNRMLGEAVRETKVEGVTLKNGGHRTLHPVGDRPPCFKVLALHQLAGLRTGAFHFEGDVR